MRDKSEIAGILRNALTEYSLNIMRSRKNGDMDATEVIAREDFLPPFINRVWTQDMVGAVVTHGSQVWELLQPYDGTVYKDPPSELRAQWGLLHSKDPAKAKPLVTPLGTSGVYNEGDCVIGQDGTVYRSLIDNNVWEPEAYPQGWASVIMPSLEGGEMEKRI